MKNTKRLTLSALFLALGLIMPFITMQVPEIGSMLLPMHIPVLICGFVCGWKYGLVVGFITPIFRSMVFGMPFMMPTAVSMAFELATYGAVAGVLFGLLRGKKLATYITLIGAMIAGRIVWGIASVAIFALMGNAFSWELFAAGALIQAVPGIILQLVIIPPVITVLHRSGFLDK